MRAWVPLSVRTGGDVGRGPQGAAVTGSAALASFPLLKLLGFGWTAEPWVGERWKGVLGPDSGWMTFVGRPLFSLDC